LLQKNDEIDELKKNMKKMEEKIEEQREQLKNYQLEKEHQISKEDFDKVEMKYTA